MDKLTKPNEFDELFSESDMMMFMMVMMMALMMSMIAPAMTQQTEAQARALAAQSFTGNEDPRVVNVTSNLSWINLVYDYPFQPWISAYIINDGPSPVEVGINYPDDRFLMNSGETITITRSGAEERISIMFFVCSIGLRSTVRVTGAY